MIAYREVDFESLLLDRREKLQTAMASYPEPSHLARLLEEVDLALERIDNGSYGLCEVCHDPIEEDRLAADPLIQFCLDHLTPTEQRALEQDLELASRIQTQLLPESQVRSNGWEIAFHYQAGGPVGGDYCDLVKLETEAGGLFFMLGDVSGKGVAASMLMTHLNAIFRSLIPLDLPLNQLVERANRVFLEGTLAEHFATLVCGRATPSGEIEICNAGHCRPLLMQGAAVNAVETRNIALGVLNAPYSVHQMQLAAGDSLFLYTDGLSEAMNRAGGQYGEDRLIRLVTADHMLSPQALIGHCLEDLRAFRAGAPMKDDLTIMVLHRTGTERFS